MKFNPDIHYRKSIHLKNYDYSQAGLYFITICTENRHCLFGTIQNDTMVLNDAGNMIAIQWYELPNRFPSVVLHEYIVMPNHFHGIIESVGAIPCGCPDRAGTSPAPIIVSDRAGARPASTIGEVVGAFKSLSTNEYIKNVKQNNWQSFAGKLWQRNYYEHIIRKEESYLKIAEYIQNNPLKWQEDKYYV
jgi:REP element-mobilizing transposase RayT